MSLLTIIDYMKLLIVILNIYKKNIIINYKWLIEFYSYSNKYNNHDCYIYDFFFGVYLIFFLKRSFRGDACKAMVKSNSGIACNPQIKLQEKDL